MASSGSAPSFSIPGREIVAVEHPMIVKNIDNGLKTFGTGVPLVQLLTNEGYDGCLPLYMRPVDPTCAPLLSHNTHSSNILLKITVPKRTGRKRKRGSTGPYLEESSSVANEEILPDGLRSHSRLDRPEVLLSSLRENIGKYHMEVVGRIDKTHRYRAITDFHYSTTNSKFMTKFRDTVLTGKVEDLRKFKLDPSKGVQPNEDLIPPPTFSDKIIPSNWGYHQNTTCKLTTDEATGATTLVNHSYTARVSTFYVPQDIDVVPSGPPQLPPPDPILESLLVQLREALSERPIWTRRAIINRIRKDTPGIYLLKPAVQYVAYQFRGGPWRDAIVAYGIDPRTDPKYRIYQTLFFKIVEEPQDAALGDRQPWHDIRSEYTRKANQDGCDRQSHIFDGMSICLDGKIWQVCDITDPLLARLLRTTTLRPQSDNKFDGWYCNGTLAKVRAIMRTKISAIRAGRELTEEDFKTTLEVPDIMRDKKRVTAPVPDLELPGSLVEVVHYPESRNAWRRRKTKGGARGKGRPAGNGKSTVSSRNLESDTIGPSTGEYGVSVETAVPMAGLTTRDGSAAIEQLRAGGMEAELPDGQDDDEDDEDDVMADEDDLLRDEEEDEEEVDEEEADEEEADEEEADEEDADEEDADADENNYEDDMGGPESDLEEDEEE